MNGYRRVLLVALLALTSAVLLFGAYLEFTRTDGLDRGDMIVLSVALGLLFYGLGLLFGVSPWDLFERVIRNFWGRWPGPPGPPPGGA